MPQITLTQIGIVVFIVAIIVFDAFVLFKKGTDHTISVTVYEFSKRYPMLPFLLGFCFGHLFWPIS